MDLHDLGLDQWFALCGLVLLSFAFPFATGIRRFGRLAVNIILGLCSAAVLLSVYLQPNWGWRTVVGLAPALLVFHHMFFLWLSKPQRTRDGGIKGYIASSLSSDVRAEVRSRIDDFVARVEPTVEASLNRYYSSQTLFVRYGVPALMLALLGLTLVSALADPKEVLPKLLLGITHGSAEKTDLLLRGARYGLVGAFVFVLLDLGGRAFRQDITCGSAIWAFLCLLLGPILAATLALIWRIGEGGQSSWQTGAVLFLAGFAPRRIVAVIEQAAAGLLKLQASQPRTMRSLPLSELRGINADVEQRLAEEGVFDAHTLAFADPVRLLRNTSYDLRQIVAWMDEALLTIYCPSRWEALEEQGITGAIDLAWASFDPAAMERLIASTKSESTLADTAARLACDEQLRRLWVLYNSFSEDQADGESNQAKSAA